MNTEDGKISIILITIGSILWGLCLIAGLGMNNDQLSYVLALAGFCFLLGGNCVFWFGREN